MESESWTILIDRILKQDLTSYKSASSDLNLLFRQLNNMNNDYSSGVYVIIWPIHK